jgi:putative FmdB family regulatory protein
MPIYEFKCKKCEEFFELLVMGSNDENEIKCPKCGEQSFERIMSTMNYNTASSSGTGGGGGLNVQERQCSGGSCSTYTIPGGD